MPKTLSKKQVIAKPALATMAASPGSRRGTETLMAAGRVAMRRSGLKESTRIKVFEIPLTQLKEHSENANEQTEKTFDELVDRLKRDGPDEPVQVVPELIKGQPTGFFVIFSGHHRKKAYQAAGFTTVDCIIREGWDEDRIAIELITRNQLRGQTNPYKFTEMFDRLRKRYDEAHLKQMMGLTDKKQFAALIKRVSDNLGPKQRRKLEEAKEKIESIDDLNSVLHTIFKEHGAELDDGFMVFNFGGKKHHYIKIDEVTSKKLEMLEKELLADDQSVPAFFKALIDSAKVSKTIKRPDAPAPVTVIKARPVLEKV